MCGSSRPPGVRLVDRQEDVVQVGEGGRLENRRQTGLAKKEMCGRSVEVAALSVAPRLSATGPPNSPMYSCATLICLAFSALDQPSSSAISAATRGMACFAA